MASPTICRLRPVEGSDVVGQDQDISGWEAPGTVNTPTGGRVLRIAAATRPRSPADQAFLDRLAKSLALQCGLPLALAQRRVKALAISAQPPGDAGFQDRSR